MVGSRFFNLGEIKMSVLLRSMLVLGLSSALLVACGEKAEEAAPVEAAAPAATEAAPAPAADAAPATGGGYEPTAEERVPGITIDASAPVEAAPAPAEAPAAP